MISVKTPRIHENPPLDFNTVKCPYTLHTYMHTHCLLNSNSCHSSIHSHASSPTVDECVGMKVWFILVISIRSEGPWEGSAIKSELWLGLFNTVSVKWLKVNGTLTQSDRTSSCSWSECCCIKVGLIHCGNTALNKRCLFPLVATMTVRCSTALRERCLPHGEGITLK